ncbi:MAG: hypothetical protein QXD95_08160 [Nitrososphaeria archaeon]
MQRLKFSLTILTIVLASMSIVYGLMFTSVYLQNVGNIKALGVGVYWDSVCSQTVSSIDWGLAEPGSVKNVTIYIRNEGNAPITLSLQTANWNPPTAASYISLSWNYGGETISLASVVKVTLSLSVSQSIQGASSFSFDIIILAIG